MFFSAWTNVLDAGDDCRNRRVVERELQGQVRQAAFGGGQFAQLLDNFQVVQENFVFVRVFVPATAEIACAEAGFGREFARQNAHRQPAAHDDADVILLAIGEDFFLGGAVEDAVINLQAGAAAVGVKGFQVFKIAGADAVGFDLAVFLQTLEALDEDFHGRVAEI
jgi:hypothetical protein